MSTTNAARTRAMRACGVVCGPRFVLVFLMAGATRAGYDPRRYPLSSLAIGDSGWVQRANIIVTGSLLLAFAVGLRRAHRCAARRGQCAASHSLLTARCHGRPIR